MGGVQIGQAGQGLATAHSWDAGANVSGGDETGPVCVGRELHAATIAPSRIAATLFVAGRFMWVIFLEMGVALGLLLLIVWWTWPKKRPGDKHKP